VRGILCEQTKHIVEEFDKSCKEQITCAVAQERWERVDVPYQYQAILDKMLGREKQSDSEEGVGRYLHVDSVHFIAVPAALTLMQHLSEYVRLATMFDAMQEVVVQRMCELLYTFNRDTYACVLRRQVQPKKKDAPEEKKKITAANLALCSQCCDFIAQLLPPLQAHLRTRLGRESTAVLLSELTKIAAAYASHQAELYEKLSTLLVDRYEFHAKKWFSEAHHEVENDADASLWAEDPATRAQDLSGLNPHKALGDFATDIKNMLRALLRTLASDSVRRIFAKAFESVAAKFGERMGQEIPAPSPPYEERLGRTLGDRLALDIAFLQESVDRQSNSCITTPLQRLLADLVCHLRVRAPADDPLRAVHPAAIEALQRLGRLPAC